MHFGNLREMSVKIGKDRKLKKSSECLPEKAGCIPLAVVMTTADGIHPVFSGRHPKLFLISDLSRVDTDIVEVHADIARRIFKFIIPLLP